jgi:hypothetical protein
MKEQIDKHLREEQIIWAVIDKQELAGDLQQHLLECDLCKGKVARFSNELDEFGQKAKQSVPPLSRQIRLPAAAPKRIRHNDGWLPIFGAVAMAGLVVFFYFMGMKTIPPVPVSPVQSQESLLEDESLMREISELVEYPLTDDIYEVTGKNGTDYDDDDFLDFDVPEMQDDFPFEQTI